jgi:hypothetical protein
MKQEIIIEFLAEGGSVTLFIDYSSKDPMYGLAVNESMHDSFVNKKYNTIHAAFKALQKYPWHWFYPGQINPAYKTMIALHLLKQLQSAKDDGEWHAQSNFEKVLQMRFVDVETNYISILDC